MRRVFDSWGTVACKALCTKLQSNGGEVVKQLLVICINGANRLSSTTSVLASGSGATIDTGSSCVIFGKAGATIGSEQTLFVV